MGGLAALSFWIEYRTRSVPRGLTGYSIALAGATADVTVRTSVWADLEKFIGQHPMQGWGWLGAWHPDLYPYLVVRDAVGNQPASALNAYVDVTLQLGFIGLALLLVALGLAFIRAWLVATERRSTVHVWPALTLVLLATTGMTESYLLVEAGFMLFVIAAFTAARERSWRGRLSG